MGKRRGGLAGVSRFVLDAFKQDSLSEPSQQHPQLPRDQSEDRPAKRQKTQNGALAAPLQDHEEEWSRKWIKKYDATGLVPHYTHASQVPEHLQKYFSQRLRYFSLYSTPPGCLLDEEGWYSITPESVADQIAERCRCDVILDAFCGVGGNSIAFAKTCERVIALDTSSTRLALARHNAQIYGVADRIEFILSDYISFANSYLSVATARKIDVIFLSPPWGGPSYISGTTTLHPPTSSNIAELEPSESHPSYSLASIQPIHGAELFKLSRRITPNIAYYLPRNTRLEEISDLLNLDAVNHPGTSATTTDPPVNENIATGDRRKGDQENDEEQEWVEVEEEWMGSKLKALTCYFGGLADGQDTLF